MSPVSAFVIHNLLINHTGENSERYERHFIAVPKKTETLDYEKHKTGSIISQLAKRNFKDSVEWNQKDKECSVRRTVQIHGRQRD